MKIKVLEVNVDDLNMGGVFTLIKNVIINKQSDVQIDIGAIERFVNPDNVRMLSELGTTVYYVGYEGSKWKKQLVCYFHLKKLLKSKLYDCVHIHGDVANKLFVSGLAAKHARMKKIILHSHAAGIDGNHRTIKRIFHKFCRRFLKNIGTEYVACSDLAAEWMFPNIVKENIKIINNGVDLEKFRFNQKKRDEMREKLGISDEILIGHVGRFAYQKNHEFLVKIMRCVKDTGIKAKLILVGEGPEEERIRRLIYSEKLEDIILMYGTSNHVEELFQAMDIFVLPSRFEGLPIAGIEAQASGLPVLFSSRITKDAKLIEHVEYLEITQEKIGEWVDRIQKCLEYERKDTSEELEKHKFSIQNTRDGFLQLYTC